MHIFNPTLTLALALFFSSRAVLSQPTVPHGTTSSTELDGTTFALPFPEGDIFWTGPVTPGGENIALRGRHGDVFRKLRELEPYWMREGVSHPGHGNHSHGFTQHDGMLAKRGRVSYQCNQRGYQAAQTNPVIAGIRWIYDHAGTAVCSVGPRSCGRFSCSWDSAILMCNPGDRVVATPCVWLGNNANFIYQTCQDSQHGTVQGQAFYEDPTYNVLIKHTGPGNDC